MLRSKNYISILFLVLLLFPLAEKTLHELGHLEEEHCSISETHFCKAIHYCSICDYLISGFSTSSQSNEQELVFLNTGTEIKFQLLQSKKVKSAHSILKLRGPPATV